MIPLTSTYAYRKHLIVAGVLALGGLAMALFFAWHSTPYTMMAFFGVSPLLVAVATGIFLYTQVRDFRARMESVRPRHYDKGEIVYRQGDRADRIYIIRKGEVEVIHNDPEKGDISLGHLGPEEFFGETGVFRHGPREATVRAESDLEVLSLHVTDFQNLYASLPRLQERLRKEYERRRGVKESVLGSKG